MNDNRRFLERQRKLVEEQIILLAGAAVVRGDHTIITIDQENLFRWAVDQRLRGNVAFKSSVAIAAICKSTCSRNQSLEKKFFQEHPERMRMLFKKVGKGLWALNLLENTES